MTEQDLEQRTRFALHRPLDFKEMQDFFRYLTKALPIDLNFAYECAGHIGYRDNKIAESSEGTLSFKVKISGQETPVPFLCIRDKEKSDQFKWIQFDRREAKAVASADIVEPMIARHINEYFSKNAC